MLKTQLEGASRLSGTGRSLRQDRARDESVIGPALVRTRQGCQAPHARTGQNRIVSLGASAVT